ncbi:uncharacterized protein LOC113272815 [Papaver somniferum]|uniref:uncharacterized protein LOC113272815 n=1 Tax=Papaver somniferum TaxID=3469 RepID=UPI000E6FA6AE|nr:uncharacterized protein LOC113272815 [Papaver somniferum]
MGDASHASHVRSRTYADQVKGKQQLPTTSIDLSSLPLPTLKEGKPAVVLPESFYLEGCDIWKFSLIGRLDFKGITFQEVKDDLEHQWQLGQGVVQLIPMSRGFFTIKLQSQAAKYKLLNAEAWFFRHQKLSLIEWFPGFDAEKQRSSHASVWVSFPGLPLEFWTEKMLLSFAKSLGTPIVVDSRTLAHEYGHFASVLVDINFAEAATDAIHITVGGLDSWQSVEIQKIPKYCSKCKLIGHTDHECRKQHKENTERKLVVSKQVSVDESQPGVSNIPQHAGGECQVARRKKKGKKKAQNVNVVVRDVVDNSAGEEAGVEFAAKLVKAQQLEIPKPVRIVTATPTLLCDQLTAGEFLLIRNRYNAIETIQDVVESSDDAKFRADQEARRVRMQSMHKVVNTTDVRNASDSESLQDSNLRICAEKGSLPRLNSGATSQIDTNSSKTGF